MQLSIIRQCLFLPQMEDVNSPVVRVVHVVVDGVDAAARAGVTAGGAAARRGSLRRGVRHHVAGTAAAALEGVVKTDPVPRLVRQSL